MQTTKLLDNPQIKNLKKEYLLKKENITKRLKEFDKFYNKSFSWFFDDGKMDLKSVEKNNDERLFEELCFCIYTANTSAEMGMKAVDATASMKGP